MTAATRPRILVVEDEAHLAEGISLNLDAEGYAPVLARNGAEALELYRRGAYDLVILDVMLPEVSGFAVCEEIRRGGGKEPVLFLTAKGRPEDRVRGLDLGGDDYLTKPFHLRELLSRVRALLRRRGWERGARAEEAAAPVRIGGAEVDFRTGDCVLAGGARERLTDKEAGILRLLVERRGEPVARAEIVERLWPGDDPPTARTIDNFVVRLRKRLEPDPSRPRHLLTVFGVGYKLVP
jgi:two-component system alkaline phosphatase synthesis response regulator PhoP